MVDLKQFELWFITGSQHLYGDETLKKVAEHATEISNCLCQCSEIPVRVVYKSVLTSPVEIYRTIEEANIKENCIGIIAWMHTFSPAKMWIKGLSVLKKPMLHLHTQYNDVIPWNEIDMDFMNENQSAHGGREFGFMVSRMRKNRKVIVGHWRNENVRKSIGTWARVAAGWEAMNKARVARFGDNMREVAVTEGDKVAAQLRFGFSTNGYGLGELVDSIKQVSDGQVKRLIDEYRGSYSIDSSLLESNSLAEAAKIELGLRNFLEAGSFNAFTDNFENLEGIKQLPGIAAQRLMADGYGFGAEGDWKTAVLLYAIKVMSQDLVGGSSFMEDYTYDFHNGQSRVLGAHMLEICPSIAAHKPVCQIHPLSIGGKEDPVRLIFDVAPGTAINVSLIDVGNRFRLIVNKLEVIKPEEPLPKLPVARALWIPQPSLDIAAQSWILAGGAHHTVFSKAINEEYMEDFAEMAGIELIIIDENTVIREIKDQLRWNEVYFHLFQNQMM